MNETEELVKHEYNGNLEMAKLEAMLRIGKELGEIKLILDTRLR